MSLFQEIVEKAVRCYLPNEAFYSNFRPEWLHGMEIDIFIPRINLAIEVNGMQHYFWCPELQVSLEDFLKQKERDKFKTDKITQKGYAFLTIKQKIDDLTKFREKIQKVTKHLRKCHHISGISSIPNTSPEIKKDWNDYFMTYPSFLDKKPVIKVKETGLEPVNSAGEKYLSNEGLSRQTDKVF